MRGRVQGPGRRLAVPSVLGCCSLAEPLALPPSPACLSDMGAILGLDRTSGELSRLAATAGSSAGKQHPSMERHPGMEAPPASGAPGRRELPGAGLLLSPAALSGLRTPPTSGRQNHDFWASGIPPFCAKDSADSDEPQRPRLTPPQ
uniref:Uncharacterized protein n=1 Tax=Sphaerodactylus townsendi TaxID=933632 RepID=A0ACB8FWC4_9SAUR